MENNNLVDPEKSNSNQQSIDKAYATRPVSSESAQTPVTSKDNASPVVSAFRSEPHKIRLKSKNARLIFGGITLLFLLLVAGNVYYFGIRSSSQLSIFSDLPQPIQTNCTATTLTYFPDQHLSFQMPSCWTIKYGAITSSNQTSIKSGGCPTLNSILNSDGQSGNTDCPARINVADASISITEYQGNNDPNIQAWMAARFTAGKSNADTSSYLPTPLYLSTTFNGQPADYLNTSYPVAGGGTKAEQSLAPSNTPHSIPACVFNGGCYVLWDNNVYEVSDTDWNSISTDNQQVFKLLESIKFD